MEQQQTEVNETNPAPAQETGAVENAQDDSLESLLAQYEEPTPEKKPEPEAPQATDTSKIENFMARQIQRENDQALSEAAGVLKNIVGDTNLTEKWFEGQLYLAGAKDPRLTRAFEDRENSPKQWETLVRTLGKELAQELKPTDQGATDSWNAVESAVHSASTSTSKAGIEAKDLKSMTDSEFMAFKRKHGFSR